MITFPGIYIQTKWHLNVVQSTKVKIVKKYFVRSGIRTHAHRSGLRPERSALDRSAILTLYKTDRKMITGLSLAPKFVSLNFLDFALVKTMKK